MDLLIETAGGVAAYGILGAAVYATMRVTEARKARELARRRRIHPSTRTLKDAA